ncbi:hypothetical protein F6X40_17015 [Paraburkholderia sp. UCT31]|uniref:hypothetical protein n=1 Tax=Paraburkholderia sp. UCT31 TaxID=2615209 RepID=UPI001655026C|nr:hypothetical protein [Paraburkholderia sp. UCT31]MBC8738478.1 hypothetical protein [Paraburkholderia sp. UCT31]
MRSKLLRSFFFVAGFWWTVAALYWSVSQPAVNLQSLKALAALFPFVHFHVPEGDAGIFDALSMQKQVLTYWTIPILTGVAVFALIGNGVVWYGARKLADERERREKNSTGKFRGLNITLGDLPHPPRSKCEPVDLGSSDNEVFASFTPAEIALLNDILGILSAHPDAFAGEGHAVSLVEMALSSVEKALSHKTRPSLAAIVAAASQLGYISAYRKDGGGNWIRTKQVERESALHLANLESWWNLPQEDRQAVSFAVRYQGVPDSLIDTGGGASELRLARSLMYKAVAAAEKASTQELERVLTKQETSELAFDTFLGMLNQVGFQDGLPKGVKAIGWKVGNRIFMLEIKLRETLMPKLPDDVRQALAAKEKRGLHPFTVELMKGLHNRGWLVTKVDGVELKPRDALWNITAGKLLYKGVLVIDIPAEHKDKLPSKDSIYAITMAGPLFTNAVIGGTVSPSPATPAQPGGASRTPVTPAQTPAAPSAPAAQPAPTTPRSQERAVEKEPVSTSGGFSMDDLSGLLRKPKPPAAPPPASESASPSPSAPEEPVAHPGDGMNDVGKEG